MQGDRRLYFYDSHNSRQVDVFIDVFRMSHVIDLRGRLDHEGPCANPSDLLLSKLQIYEVNRKDLVDLVALVLDHPVQAGWGDEVIDAGYVARVASQDWGLYRTLQVNTEKLRASLDELWRAVEAQPKPLKWKLRAQVGDRVQWYELPEETRSPYQPE